MVQLKGARRGEKEGGAVTVCVLGKGGDRGQLGIPPQIDEDVEYLQRLPYPVRGAGHACVCAAGVCV